MDAHGIEIRRKRDGEVRFFQVSSRARHTNNAISAHIHIAALSSPLSCPQNPCSPNSLGPVLSTVQHLDVLTPALLLYPSPRRKSTAQWSYSTATKSWRVHQDAKLGYTVRAVARVVWISVATAGTFARVPMWRGRRASSLSVSRRKRPAATSHRRAISGVQISHRRKRPGTNRQCAAAGRNFSGR
jgi:hypothetical protein